MKHPYNSNNITFQESLRPELPFILGNKEYEEEIELLDYIHNILLKSGIESLFIKKAVTFYQKKQEGIGGKPQLLRQESYAKKSRQALRCIILKHLKGLSYRKLSLQLAHSALYQNFTYCQEIERVRIPSKSSLQSFSQYLPEEELEEIIQSLNCAISDQKKAEEIGLIKALELEFAYIDSTCLKADIHFPVDWLLLRDVVRSLIKKIILIRKKGLKYRMTTPENFLSAINSLSMQMSATQRKKGGKKERKAVLRKMKAIVSTVEKHARRYRELLDKQWHKTSWSRGQAEMILKRMDKIIEQIPEAKKQAHQRIISETPVVNKEKKLSIYEDYLHVIKRGKAGASVEFGNELFLVESEQGYLIYHELSKESSGGDSQWLVRNLKKIQQSSSQQVRAIGADRKFDTTATRKYLEQEGVYNGICCRSGKRHQEKLKVEKEYGRMVRRRAQLEGRIGILKNVFLAGKAKSKGYEQRKLEVSWAVLAHNLWVVGKRGKWKEPPANE